MMILIFFKIFHEFVQKILNATIFENNQKTKKSLWKIISKSTCSFFQAIQFNDKDLKDLISMLSKG